MDRTEETGSVRKRVIHKSGGSRSVQSNSGKGSATTPTESEADTEKLEKMESSEKIPEKNGTLERKIELVPETYWLTRIFLIRYLAFVYSVAFLVAAHQNSALLGDDGLLPVPNLLRRVSNVANDNIQEMLRNTPTILWFVDWQNDIDTYLYILSYSGLAISLVVLLTGCANMIMMFLLWVLYHSIVNVGQRWYSFGWESQILETGFLAIFLCPVFTLRQIPKSTPPSIIVMWAYRWLIFRIMIGAGLIKIRGDKCWRDLTCMNYHYETQPVPNPIAYYLHQSPEIMHQFETLSNHFIELIAPFLLLPFLPRRFRIVGGFIQVFFQIVLIISGNLSFLNWLTIVPSIACFDDQSLAWMFSSKRGSAKWNVWDIQEGIKQGRKYTLGLGGQIRLLFNLALGMMISLMSVPVILNLMSSSQVMNTSFESLRIVNTYGAFGSITKQRTEVIFQGTHGSPNNPNSKWLEYEFKCKPGNLTRRPCLISPYHYRLDWLMWFAAFGNYEQHPWLIHLATKLLVNDPLGESIIEKNPFHGKNPPQWIRAEHYRYTYTKMGSKEARKGKWWKRRYIGNYLPPISLESIKDYMNAMRWKLPEKLARDPH